MTTRPATGSGQTFGRALRLLKTTQFKAVYGFRARVGDGRLVVYARPNQGGATRLGLSVGKVVGNSVRRNYVKRLLRETFRRMRPALPVGYDLVIVPLAGDYSLEDVGRRLQVLTPAAIRRAAEKGRPERQGPA
jgi:ribonuclease P protein component